MYSRRWGHLFSSCVHHFHRCIRRCRCRRGSGANIRPVNIGDRCTAISFFASSKFRCWWSRSIGRSARLWCKRPDGWHGRSRSRCWWHLASSTFHPFPVETISIFERFQKNLFSHLPGTWAAHRNLRDKRRVLRDRIRRRTCCWSDDKAAGKASAYDIPLSTPRAAALLAGCQLLSKWLRCNFRTRKQWTWPADTTRIYAS
jgi:hypothetical protein